MLRRASLVNELKPKALEILKRSKLPLGVGDVAKGLGISWSTARQILTELELEGRVSSLKTSKSKIYFPKGEGPIIQKVDDRFAKPLGSTEGEWRG